jgi:diacylglycerol kinase family enzyme
VFGIAVTSGRYVGGGFPVSSEAWINDGLLDVTVVPVMPLGDAFAAGMEFTFGRDGDSNRIETHRVASVHIYSQPPLPYSLDGEGEQSLATRFEVIPDAIRFAVASLAPAIDRQRHLQIPLEARESR